MKINETLLGPKGYKIAEIERKICRGEGLTGEEARFFYQHFMTLQATFNFKIFELRCAINDLRILKDLLDALQSKEEKNDKDV